MSVIYDDHKKQLHFVEVETELLPSEHKNNNPLISLPFSIMK